MGRAFSFTDDHACHEIKTIRQELLLLERYVPSFAHCLYPYYQQKVAPFYYYPFGEEKPIPFPDDFSFSTFLLFIEQHDSFVRIGDEEIVFSECVHTTIMRTGHDYEKFLMTLRMSDTPLTLKSSVLSAYIKAGIQAELFPESWTVLTDMKNSATIADDYTEDEPSMPFTFQERGCESEESLLKKLGDL